MLKLDKISILVPVHNGVANGLRDSLSSILSQDYQNIELIVIDDASSDSSIELVNQFCKPPHCKKIVHQSNQGLAASLNDGVISADGRYLMIMQQDCALISKDALSKSIEFMSNNKNVDILIGRQIYDLNKLNFYQKFSEFSLDHFLLYSSTRGELDLTEIKCDIIRKEIMDKIGLFDITQRVSGEDQIFSNRALKLGFKMYLGEEPKYMNQLLGENTLLKVLKKQFRYGRYSWILYKKMYRDKPIKSSGISYVSGKMYNRIMSVSFSLITIIFLALFLSTLFYGFLCALLLAPLIRVFIGYRKLANLRKKYYIPRFSGLLVFGMLILSDFVFTLGLTRGFFAKTIA